MRAISKTNSVLTLCLAFAFGLFFAIPAQDVPETAYDESETAPYENTPSLPSEVEAESILVALRSPTPGPALGAAFLFASAGIPVKHTERTVHRICDCLTILDHSLRC